DSERDGAVVVAVVHDELAHLEPARPVGTFARDRHSGLPIARRTAGRTGRDGGGRTGRDGGGRTGRDGGGRAGRDIAGRCVGSRGGHRSPAVPGRKRSAASMTPAVR